MTYKEAFKNIRSDYRRYSELYPNCVGGVVSG